MISRGLGFHDKPIHRGIAEQRGLDSLLIEGGGLSKKEGVLLLRRTVDILMHTMYY